MSALCRIQEVTRERPRWLAGLRGFEPRCVEFEPVLQSVAADKDRRRRRLFRRPVDDPLREMRGVSVPTPPSVADATMRPVHRTGGRHRFRAAADHRQRP
jgi:hypothetical protein